MATLVINAPGGLNVTNNNPPAVAGDAEPMEVTIKCEACPVEAVTVFVDRAEVTRVLTFAPEFVGPHTLIVEGLPSVIDNDSIRVRGTGEVVILEVTHEQRTKVNTPEDSQPGENKKGERKEKESKKDSQREQELEQQKEKKKREDEEKKAKVEALNKKIAAAQEAMLINNQAQTRIEKQLHLIDTYAKNVVIPHTSVEKDSKQQNFDVVANVISYQQDKLVKLDEESNKLRLSNADWKKQITEYQLEIVALNVLPAPPATQTTNNIIIGVDVKKVEKLEFRVVYMVRGASWSPSYDVRVSTKDNTLSVVYYGNVQQTSGEDWKNAVLTLSTAVPSLGGAPPTLPTKRVFFGYPAYGSSFRKSVAMTPYAPSSSSSASSYRLEDQVLEKSASITEEMEYASVSSSSAWGGSVGRAASAAMSRVRAAPSSAPSPPPPPAARVATAEAAENTTFRIARLATIISGQKPKKVTVTQLNLQSRFVHYSVPALCEHAFIKATTCNSSDFFLLGSNAVSIFVDGNFVSTSQLPNVSPWEEFDSYLGVDPAVRIEQKPMSKVHSKKGFLLAKQDDDLFSLVTVVKNTKKVPLMIVLKQQLPLSQDQKIKVSPITPTEEDLKAGGEAQAKQDELETKVGLVHSLHKDHPMIKVERADAWNCDGCHRPRQQPRYRCMRGCDFDLCEDCWTKEIRVTDHAKYDATAGVVEWFRTVAPGKEIQVPYSYSVKWPSGQHITIA